ncbi:Mitochondrial Translation Optimization [Haplosporangium gracile]|nr:Mitochondrial Translation Optimization [Haplosporangium gracile]
MIITVAIALAAIKGIFTPVPVLNHVADSTTTTVKSSTNGSTTTTTTITTTTLSSSSSAAATNESVDSTAVVSEKSLEPTDDNHKKRDKKDKEDKKDKKDKGDKPPAPAEEEDPNIPYISTQDCNACPTPCKDEDHPHYPSYLKIDHELPLLHSMKPYIRHVLISTGQDDWDAHIDSDPAQLAHHMQKAIDAGQQRLRDENGGKDVPRIVLTNSSRKAETWDGPGWQVVILPDQIVVNDVVPEQCDDFFEAFLRPAVGAVFDGPVTTTVADAFNKEVQVEKDGGHDSTVSISAVNGAPEVSSASSTSTEQSADGSTRTIITTTTTTASSSFRTISASSSSSSIHTTSSEIGHFHHATSDTTRQVRAGSTTFLAHRWLPKSAIMICSHGKRDNRCSKTAPFLKKQFLQCLRQKDIYGDAEGDVEIWLVSHIGGHKFAGNVIVHRSEPEEKTSMAIWYGRVEPCHAAAIIEATVERGEVIRELYRGAMLGSFDPSKKKKVAW